MSGHRSTSAPSAYVVLYVIHSFKVYPLFFVKSAQPLQLGLDSISSTFPNGPSLREPGIVSPSYKQKVLYFFNFERLGKEAQRAHGQTMSSKNQGERGQRLSHSALEASSCAKSAEQRTGRLRHSPQRWRSSRTVFPPLETQHL
ncbi:unnamed protein product [Rangifer tarandus platyrhynchus]|uniref:Uncharacterized protein n=1 Tax=Rangifer tarandus platyrhynchus TaxID=3082113 RepID=A0AC59ZR19_RANTA